MNYRQDIDGLRGLAVLVVVVNHAAPDIPLFESGFIGVDIFFVISGYLITSIIVQNLADNNFSLKKFWARRIRRILPTLILMLAVMVPIFYSIFGPYLKQDLLKNTAQAATFISNFSSNGEADYFGAQVLNPLLHLWSLAIEEQFYLLWPLLCFLAFKIGRTRAIKAFSALILFGSFLANLFTIYFFENIPLAFYYPHTRIWELMMGAILAQSAVPSQYNSTPSYLHFQKVASSAGLILLIIGFLFIRETSYFPGYWALLPVLGTSGLIFGGANTQLTHSILTNPIIVWFGNISYALYLWHFPLLFLLRQLKPGPTNKPLTIFIVLLSISIAWLTTKLIEKPIRFGKLRRIPASIYLASLMTVGSIALSCMIFVSGPKTDAFILEKIEAEGRLNQNKECLKFRKEISVRTFIRQNCFTPTIASRPIIFLVGDSHAASLRLGLKPYLNSKGINLLGSTIGGCMWTNFKFDQGKQCRDINEKVMEEIARLKPDLVIVDNYWSKLARYGSFDEYIIDYIRDLNEIGVEKIALIGQIPTWSEEGLPLFLLKNYAQKGISIPKRHLRLEIENDTRTSNQEHLRRFEALPGVTYLSMDNLLCNQDSCITMVGPNLETDLIVWDYGHLTPAGSKYISERMFADIEKLLAG